MRHIRGLDITPSDITIDRILVVVLIGIGIEAFGSYGYETEYAEFEW